MTLAFATVHNRLLLGLYVPFLILLLKSKTVLSFQQKPNVAPHATSSSTMIGVSISSPPPPKAVSVENKSETNPLRDHLQEMLSQVKSKPFLSFYMDDDLRRMETEYYNLSPEDAPECLMERSAFSYDGPTVRPDESCYQTVTEAYGLARQGKRGAELAEDVARRYESYNGGYYVSRYILKGVLKAVVNSRQFDKAYEMIQLAEDHFSETKDILLAPDTRMYNSITDGLSRYGAADRMYSANMTMTILEHMREKYISGENPMALPNRYTYTHVMQSNARVGKGGPIFQKLSKLYHQLQGDYQRLGYFNLKPDALSTLPLFKVALNSRGNYKVLEEAFGVYEELQDQYAKTGDEDYRPIEPIYKYLFTAAARLGYAQTLLLEDKVDNLISSMKKDVRRPSVYTITTVMNAKAAQRNGKSMTEAEEIMRESKCADSVAYQTLIKGYARIGNAGKALELLEELKDWSGDNSVEVSTLGSIIDALAKCSEFNKNPASRKNASLKAEHILNQIVLMYQEGEVTKAEKGIDGKVFDSILRLMGRTKGNAARILAVVEDMEKLNQLVPGQFTPTPSTYTLAIDALGRCGDGRAAKMVSKLLKKIEEPNIRVLASALSCFAKGNCKGMLRKVEDLYQHIINRYKGGDRSAKVNAQLLTTVLSTVLRAQSADAAERATKLMRKAIELARNGVECLAPNTICFNTLMNGYARRRQSEAAWLAFEEMKALHSRGSDTAPDAITYACVARAAAWDSDSKRAVERIDAIVAEVQEEIETGDLEIDTQLFNTLIKSYSFHSKDEECVASRTNDLLCQLEFSSITFKGIAPDKMTYKNAGEAFAMSRAPNAADLAINVFNKAEVLSRDGTISPLDSDMLSFAVLAKTRLDVEDAVQDAEDFVHGLENMYQSLLNTRCYNTLLAAYANSDYDDRVARAGKIFEKLVSLRNSGQRSCEPDTNTFNWLILAAANSHSSDPEIDRATFEFALEHFKSVHKSTSRPGPDSLTYEFFLRACEQLLPQGETRSKLVGKALSLCSKGGLVTKTVCFVAAKSDFTAVWDRLEKTEESRRDSIAYMPDEWCRNVPRKRRRTRVNLGHLIQHEM